MLFEIPHDDGIVLHEHSGKPRADLDLYYPFLTLSNLTEL